MRLEFRGLHQAAYRRFLQELGGTEISPFRIEGSGWMAELEPEDTLSFSKVIHIPRTYITFNGDPEVAEQVIAQFRLKALRIGG